LAVGIVNRDKLRKVLLTIAAIGAIIVIVDALDLFDDKYWSEISHGNHSHFVPYNKDEGVSVSNCPQHPPAANELITSQCQILELVSVEGTTHYVPTNRNPNVPLDRFPTRPPGSGVVVTANGELAAADAH
jgi:hypothetical protein